MNKDTTIVDKLDVTEADQSNNEDDAMALSEHSTDSHDHGHIEMPEQADLISDTDVELYHEDFHELKNIIEASLLVANEPIGFKKIQSLFLEDATPSLNNIKSCLAKLRQECDDRGIELKQIGQGFRFQSKEKYATWLRRLQGQKIPRYSRAVLETLAIIAYKQPVTRADIEEIRGVSVSSDIIKTLIGREWINEVGKKEVPGRPSLYGTSAEFLSYFNCQGLSDLPDLPDLRELSQIAKENQIDLPDLINDGLAAQWQEQIAAIHEEGIDDELPEAIEINLDPFAKAEKTENQDQANQSSEVTFIDDDDFNGEEFVHEQNPDDEPIKS